MTNQSVLQKSASLVSAGCCLVSRLALGTKVAAAVSHGNTLNSSAADGAEVAAEAVGNLELKVGGAPLTTGAEVGVRACPFITDG